MSRVSVTAARKALLAEKKLASIRTGTGKDHLTYHALKKSMGLFQENAFVPWVSYVFPPEILASYGLTPLIPELGPQRLQAPSCESKWTGLSTAWDWRGTYAVTIARPWLIYARDCFPPHQYVWEPRPCAWARRSYWTESRTITGSPFAPYRLSLIHISEPTRLRRISYA